VVSCSSAESAALSLHVKGEWVVWKKPETLASDPPPPAVDVKTWTAAQRRLDGNRRYRRRRVRRSFLLGEGMLRCGCGATMTGRIPRPGYHYYACNASLRPPKEGRCKAGYIRTERVDREVWGLIERMMTDPHLIEECAERTHADSLPEWQDEPERIERSISRLDEDADRARRAHRMGTDTLEEYQRNKEEIAADRAAWEERADGLRNLIEEAERRQGAVDWVSEALGRVKDRIGAMGLDDRRALLQQLYFKVTVLGEKGERRIRVEWAGAALDEIGDVAPLGCGTKRPVL
jgi:hypothetical protein